MKGYLLKTDKIVTVNNEYERLRYRTLPSHETFSFEDARPTDPITYEDKIIVPLVLCRQERYGEIVKKHYYIEDDWITDYIEGLVDSNDKLEKENRILKRQQSELEEELVEVNDVIRNYNVLPWFKKIFKRFI